MYAKSASYYDAIYAAMGKDYAREAARIHALIQQYRRSTGHALLDVACGTGGHLIYLQQHYAVEGLDASEAMLALARRKLPDVAFHLADMASFDLGRRFDAVVCLFSAIGYAMTAAGLRQTLATMSRHLHPGGVAIVEPWLRPEAFQEGLVHAVFVDQPDLKAARMNVSRREGQVSVLDFHYLVATPHGVEHFTERHEMGLFSDQDYLTAFRAAGLEVAVDPEGLTGRGLYVGVRPTG